MHKKGSSMKDKQRPSAVSVCLKTTKNYLTQQNQVIRNKPSLFTIKLAQTLEQREEVFRLAYKVYRDKGYIQKNESKWLIRNWDFYQSTILLTVLDQNNKLVGSVSLLFNDDGNLPAESLFQKEINVFKEQQRTIAEIARFVIDPAYRHSKEILVLLFNHLYIYSYHVKQCKNLFIEVNPKHTLYYKTLMHFEECSVNKPNPNVSGAPAILMHLSLTNERHRLKSKQDQNKAIGRSLYGSFINHEQELLVADYLKRQSKPMTQEQKIYFGFSDSNLNNYFQINLN